MVGVPNRDVQKCLMFDAQDLVRIGHHLLVPLEHDPCPAVQIPPPWLEVGGHLFHLLNHQYYHKILVNIYTFWLG